MDIVLNMRKTGKKNKIFIIAEAGVNHNGDLRLAKRLIDAAKSAGADAVKFQTFLAEKLVIAHAPQAAYQRRNARDVSQLAMLEKLELSFNAFRELSVYSQRKGIMFLSTPFESESARFLYDIKMPIFKISSGDLNNIPFLIEVARYHRPMIVSTGMSTLAEVGEAVQAILKAGNKKLTLLHCTSNYPTAYEDVNLRAMATLRMAFGFPIGLSDHTPGIEVAVAAVALGAQVIEKHFTLNKEFSGPDHKASLDPSELAALVRAVRHIESAFGDGIKAPRRCEIAVRAVARKSLVVVEKIPAGTALTKRMLAIKRPGTGIEPKDLSKVVGRHLRRAASKDEVLEWRDIKEKAR